MFSQKAGALRNTLYAPMVSSQLQLFSVVPSPQPIEVWPQEK